MAIWPSSLPGVRPERASKLWSRSKDIAGRSKTALRPPRTNSGSTIMKRAHGTAGIVMSRSSLSPSPWWPPSALTPTPRRPQKQNAERRLQRLQDRTAIDPLVGPGNPPHRHPPCPKTDQPRSRHCMVRLATRTSSHCSKSSHQTEYATVMLGRVDEFDQAKAG